MIKDFLFDCANEVLTVIVERQDGTIVKIAAKQATPVAEPAMVSALPQFMDAFQGQYAYWSDGQITETPAKPSVHHLWNWTTKQWEDPRTLQEHKDAKWEEIKRARAEAEASTFTWNGLVVDADMARITGAATRVLVAQALGMTYSDTWTLADNSTITVSGEDVYSMGAALGDHVSACHARGRELRQLIYACTDVEQVQAISWSLP